MATVEHTDVIPEQGHLEHKDYMDSHDGAEWGGGKRPFKASYGKLMMWYFLLSDAFTFAGFLIAYGAIRFSMPSWPVPDHVFSAFPFVEAGNPPMPLIFVTVMTFILILSSVTMVRAVQEGHRRNKRGIIYWMALTVVGGAAFLGCQAWEWNTMINVEGVTVTKNPFSSHLDGGTYLTGPEIAAAGYGIVTKEEHGKTATYYLQPGKEDIEENRLFVKKDHHGHDLSGTSFVPDDPYLITYNHGTHLYEPSAYRTPEGKVKAEVFGPIAFGSLFFFITGFHGFHVFSGVVFLLIILINVASGLYHDRTNNYEMVEKIGLYWHFVDLVWVFVFLVFYLL